MHFNVIYLSDILLQKTFSQAYDIGSDIGLRTTSRLCQY